MSFQIDWLPIAITSIESSPNPPSKPSIELFILLISFIIVTVSPIVLLNQTCPKYHPPETSSTFHPQFLSLIHHTWATTQYPPPLT